MSGLRIDVADLLAHPGARRAVRIAAEVGDMIGSAARIEGPVEVVAGLQRIPDGIVVRGDVTARWHGQCSACLRELDEVLTLHVDELFEAEPVEGETYPIEGHEIDLEQMVRDTVLLELPLAPHCVEPCADVVDVVDGTQDSPEATTDPRWAVLSELEIN